MLRTNDRDDVQDAIVPERLPPNTALRHTCNRLQVTRRAAPKHIGRAGGEARPRPSSHRGRTGTSAKSMSTAPKMSSYSRLLKRWSM